MTMGEIARETPNERRLQICWRVQREGTWVEANRHLLVSWDLKTSSTNKTWIFLALQIQEIEFAICWTEMKDLTLEHSMNHSLPVPLLLSSKNYIEFLSWKTNNIMNHTCFKPPEIVTEFLYLLLKIKNIFYQDISIIRLVTKLRSSWLIHKCSDTMYNFQLLFSLFI